MLHVTEGQYKRIKGAKPSVTSEKRPYTAFLPKRTDANQTRMVSNLRKLGFSVETLHTCGNGMFDLIASKHGLNVLVEVKDGLKPPSAREYTPKQRKFNFSWQGLRCVVTCDADCLRFATSVNVMLKAIKEAGIAMEVKGNSEKQYQPSLY